MPNRFDAPIRRPAGLAATAAVVVVLALGGFAQAQTSDGRPPGNLLGDLFGRGDSSERGARAQMSESDMVVRLERLENQIRQLTGAIEQLQFRNQQLEQALQRTQIGAAGAEPPRGAGTLPARPLPQPSSGSPQTAPQPGRRSDVFDPSQHPNAPGVPRPLGGTSIINPEPGSVVAPPGVGIPGGRQAGEPLDLSTLSAPGRPAGGAGGVGPGVAAAGPDGTLPPPPPRNTSATGAHAAVEPPSQAPQDQYDLAYGYLLRKDYALSEAAFRKFLKEHPSSRLVPDATYWLGESMYQRQQYRDAAESFLAVTTKHEQAAKAPDALYRLGQSLAAMGEKEAACAALGEIARKYPRASASVKQGVGREQKRVKC